MGGLFKSPKISRPAAVPAAPPTDDSDPALEAAREEERRRNALRRGRASTILTGPQGLAGTAPVQKKTLLGQ